MSNPAPAAPPAETTPKPGTSAPAPAVPAAPAANDTSKQTISKQLFPDFMAADGTIQRDPVLESSKPAAAAPAPAPTPVATPTPAPAAPATPPSTPEYLDLTSLQGKMMKIVVEGVEYDVPADEAIKNVQLGKFLTHKAQRLAAQEKELQERLKNQALPATAADELDNEGNPKPAATEPVDDPRISRLEKIVIDQNKQIAALSKSTAGIREQGIVDDVAARILAETGANDFRDYLPEIHRAIQATVTNVEEFRQAIQNPGVLDYHYSRLKIKDMQAGKKPSLPVGVQPGAANPPAARPPSPPPVAPIEGAGGSSAVDLQGEAWQTKANELYEKALTTGSESAWTAYIAFKHQKPD